MARSDRGRSGIMSAMRMPNELLTSEEAMAAYRRLSDTDKSALWPALSGNEIYALANAAADAYRVKSLTAPPPQQESKT